MWLNDVEGNRLRYVNFLVKKYLSEVKKNLGSKDIFYELLEWVLYNYLKVKLNIEISEMFKEYILKLLSEWSVNFEVVF